jgi:hypothetical protein
VNGLSREMVFTHKMGKDLNSILYNDTYGITYGKKDIIIDGNLSGVDTTELDYQSYIMKDNMYSTNMIKLSDEEATSLYEERVEYEPLIGFYNNKYVAGQVRIAGYDSVITNYIYATHAKNMGGVSYDLNYQSSNIDFTQTGYDVERGLYNIFWKNYINNLIDEDARKVELYVDLTINDITNLDMRNKILIEGQVYILEKVEYDPSNDNSSKITLIKEIINTPGTFTEEDLLLLNDSGEFITTGNDDKIII